MKYSSDKRVGFDINSHSYTLKDKKLISVTTFINQFKNEFDSDYHSKRIAERDGKRQEDVLNEWSEKAKRSCEIGTAIHKIFEDYAEGNFLFKNGELCFDFLELQEEYTFEFLEKSKVAIEFIKDFFVTGRLIPVHSEYIVYNGFLAGQIDMVCKNKKGEYFIIDFKTNSKIETNGYNKFLKSPFSDYPDCSFYHYSLQLGIYSKMYKEEIKNNFIIHIGSEKYNIIECVDVFKQIEFSDFLICAADQNNTTT